MLCNASLAQNWQLIWQDEFNGNTLDQTKWSHDLGTGSAQGLNGWGNGELQYYQPENTTLANGILTIEAKQETQGISDFYSGFQPYYYSSSKIHTRDKFEFIYGKVEARIKTVDGEGYWPAFWMLSGGCWPESGEIDIMEQWGNDGNTSVTTGAAHLGNCGDGSSNYTVGTSTINSGSYADDYHVYSVIWYEDYVAWYVDDVLFHTITPSSYPSQYAWPFNSNDWYLILNLAITNSGPNGNTTFPNQIDVDYVRVYQTDDIVGCTNPSATNYNPNANMDNGTCSFNVNFSVNMNCSNENFNTVYVTGPFTNWCGDCFPLTDNDNNGVWTGTYDFPEGALEYKYELDNWITQENLVDDMVNGASCAPVTDYFNYANRLIDINEEVNLNDSYGSCDACSASVLGCTNPLADNYNSNATEDDGSCLITGCTDSNAANYNSEANVQGECSYMISFNLDMNDYGGAFNTPEVNGSWDGWCGACTPMSDTNSDGIWEAEIELTEGFYEFKFALDNWSEAETFIGGESCTLTTGEFVNRTLNVDGNISYGTVCWESCEPCVNSGCTDPLYLEFDYDALVDDGSCQTLKIYGCTYPLAENYNGSANADDLSCIINLGGCPGDFTQDGAITAADLTGFLSIFGNPCNE